MDVLDPALTRPGRMGRHVWFRTPTKDDRVDIFDLYLDKVAHEDELDTPMRRDEIARITNGYSPAMIEQICSMALTNAHHEGKAQFGWTHLVDAMTVIESGTAIGVQYVESETRATAIHEAGHAAAAHIYRPDLESSRLSIRMRGRSLGHHQSFQREERFSEWQTEAMGNLIHILGAMAAERVFYNENTNGVGGDLQSATQDAAWMVGTSGMGPQRIELNGVKFADETEEQTRERIMKRFEKIGLTLMNRTRGSADFQADPIAAVLQDPYKRASAAQILGQAYVTAENFIAANRDAVERIAEAVIDKRELYGDDLMQLLNAQDLRKPELDWMKEETWPRI
jgi:ATP-dependent Zn protease